VAVVLELPYLLANFTNCGSVSGFGGFGAAVNPGGTFVYYNNFINPSDILTFCSINSNGTLNHCAHTTQQGQVGVDSFMAVNPAGNFLYIAPDNGSTFITACPINQATGDITAPCIQEPDGSTGSQYLAISPNGNFIYYTGSGSLLYAPLNSTTGAIGTPNTAGVANGHILAGVAIDPTGQFLYVANILAQGNCQLSACSVNPSTGFPTCTPSPTTVPCNQLAGITMDPLGGKVYIKTPGVNSQQCIVTGMVIGACSNMPEDNFNQLAIR
jgi:DNA-binding beta-propeller fold protein YncE